MTARTATKTADSKPFDFNLDAVKSEVDLTPFRFNFAGRRYTMTHLEDLNIWDLMEVADRGEIGAMVGAFKAALGNEFDDFRAQKLPQYKLKALFEAYRKHCGVESGESDASPTS